MNFNINVHNSQLRNPDFLGSVPAEGEMTP